MEIAEFLQTPAGVSSLLALVLSAAWMAFREFILQYEKDRDFIRRLARRAVKDEKKDDDEDSEADDA